MAASQAEKCMLTMYSLRPSLCDVMLVTDDGLKIVAHRIVLASAIQYFNAMFVGSGDTCSTPLKYIESGQTEISIKNIDGQALNQIVAWCYTGRVDVNEHNVQQLLAGAKMLDTQDIVNTCVDYVRSQMNPENALGIYQFAELLGCLDLQHFALNYVQNTFVPITLTSEEFLQLEQTRLVELISSDYIDTGEHGEIAVLKALISWIEYKPTERQSCLSNLIEHIRFPRLNQEALIAIEDEYPLLKTDTVCKDLLIEAMKFHLCKGQLLPTVSSTNARYRIRAPIGRPKCLVVVGGQAPKAIRQCEFYDFSSEKWSEIRTELPTRRCRAGLAVLNGLIYAIGGFNGSLRVRTVDAYDPQAGQWISCPSMEARRSTLGVGVLHNKIYAVGGFDGSSGLNSSEVYDPQGSAWAFIASMSTKRSSVGVATLGEFLYAVGGYDGASRQCLSSVEYYNSSTDTWHLITDMSQRRSGAGVGVLDSKLYVFGGHDGPAVRKSVECYDPVTNSWVQCADMIVARRNAGVVARDGFLYVVGGDDGQQNLMSVEIYDPKQNSWSFLPNQMSIGRSYAGVCIIDKFWA